MCILKILAILLAYHHGTIIHVWGMDISKINTITSFSMKNHAASTTVISACWNHHDVVQLAQVCSVHGLRIQSRSPDNNTDMASFLRADVYPLAVVVDLACEASSYVLKMASEQKLFTRLHHWLLLVDTDEVPAVLEFLHLPLDSHVSLARGGKDHVLLQDVYHVARGQPLIVTAPRYWQPSTNLPQPPSRINYGGISIRTVTVLAEGTWENFMDFQLRHLNTESKVQYVLMGHIAEMLNFRMDVCLTNTWGYPINGSKCFNGAVGMLQCGGCEIGATGLLFKTERMAVIDYAGETIAFRGAFMFLKPSLSEVSVIYELPFDTSVWITYTVTVAVLTIVLMFTRRVYQHVNPSPGSSPVGWGDTIMDSLAIVCQQDALHSPKNISSRVVFFCMLLLTVFLITSYSATIVSLLQTSSDSINTLSDLMRSPLKLSMIDIFVNETTDPEVTKVFKEKLYTQPFEEAFTTEEVGIEKIRKGLFAFHGLAGSYKIISDTYEDHEKCRFKEIEMFSSLHISFTAKKGSPYIPHIKERTCWLREVGLVDRENRRWFYQKPKCETAEQNFVSVGIQDFYPALVVMAYGAVFSIGMLIMEVLYYRKKEFSSCVPHKIMY